MPNDRPINEADDLRDAAREAHEAMKDMRLLMKEAEALLDRLRVAAHEDVDKRLTEEVAAGLKVYHEEILTHTDVMAAAITAKFELIYDMLMGKDDTHRKKYGINLEEAIGLTVMGDKDALKKRIEEELNANPVEGVIK